jgi:hypothetical protein
MAESGGSEEMVLYAKLVIDSSKAIENTRQAVSDLTFQTAGTTPGTSASEASRRRGTRDQESAYDRDTSRFSLEGELNIPSRKRASSTAALTSVVGTWGNIRGPSGGGAFDAEGYHNTSTARVRRGYRRNEYSQDWESSVTSWAQGEERHARFVEDTKSGRGGVPFDFSTSPEDYDVAAPYDSSSNRSLPGKFAHARRIQKNRNLTIEREEGYAPGYGPNADLYRQTAEQRAEDLEELTTAKEDRLGSFQNFFDSGREGEEEDAPGKGGKGGKGGLGVFYKRFLLMEAIRSVSQTVSLASQSGARAITTNGNPISLLQMIQGEQQAYASAIPFGIGSLGLGISDLMTGNATAIQGAITTSQFDDEQGATRESLSQARLQIRRQVGVLSSRQGLERDLAGVETKRLSDVDDARKRMTTDMTALQKDADKAKMDLVVGMGYQWMVSMGVSPDSILNNLNPQARPNEIAQYHAINQTVTKARNDVSVRYNQDVNQINTGSGIQTWEAHRDANESNMLTNATAALNDQQSSTLIRADSGDYYDPRFQSSRRIQQLRFDEQNRRDQERKELRDVQVHHPELAGAKEREINSAQSRRTKDIDDATYNINTETEGSLAQQKSRFTESAEANQGILDRDPEEVRTARFNAALRDIQRLPPENRDAATAAANADRAVNERRQTDRQEAMGGSLALRQRVSGMRAQAFGPGADMISRQADVAQIVGGSELEAEGYLRDSSISQSARQNFADSARQTGINDLGTSKADYIRGLHMVSASPWEIPVGNKDSSSPENVIKAFDEGIQQLKGDIGKYDISTSSEGTGKMGDNVSGLLNRILEALTTGGALRAQP